MTYHKELLELANHLARKEPKKPKQASLKRSISSAYYALFHFTIDQSLQLLFKNNHEVKRIVNRKFVHRILVETARRYRASTNLDIAKLCRVIIMLQKQRHDADYDTTKNCYRATALSLIKEVADFEQTWKKCSATATPEFTAFVTELLFGKPR